MKTKNNLIGIISTAVVSLAGSVPLLLVLMSYKKSVGTILSVTIFLCAVAILWFLIRKVEKAGSASEVIKEISQLDILKGVQKYKSHYMAIIFISCFSIYMFAFALSQTVDLSKIIFWSAAGKKVNIIPSSDEALAKANNMILLGKGDSVVFGAKLIP